VRGPVGLTPRWPNCRIRIVVFTLHPGDVFFTGTPEGVGPIYPGDVIDAAIERVGSMRVHVRAA
jgi:2-keto-4-pentenoate hydratase/2-oxohepta-3-ene-1,7-dioic acid hydratase in catechol pathway